MASTYLALRTKATHLKNREGDVFRHDIKRTAITLSLASTAASDLINTSATSMLSVLAAICRGVSPFYDPWMRVLNNNNDNEIT